MGRKRPGAFKSAKRKGKKKKKGAKFKGAQDWYDAAIEEAEALKPRPSAVRDDVTGPSLAQSVRQGATATTSDHEEEEAEDEEEAPYQTLLSSLLRDNAVPEEHLNVLKRVRKEQFGEEEMSLISDEPESESESGSGSESDEENEEAKVDLGALTTAKLVSTSSEGAKRVDVEEEEVSEGREVETEPEFHRRFNDLYGFQGRLEQLKADLGERGFVDSREVVRLEKQQDMAVVTEAPEAIAAAKDEGSEEASGAEGMSKTFQVKARLAKRWIGYVEKRRMTELERGYAGKLAGRDKTGCTKLQRFLLQTFGSYRDTLFMDKTLENYSRVREAMVLHVLNHLMKASDLQARHAESIKAAKVKAKLRAQEKQVQKHLGGEAAKDSVASEIPNDQGFTRPKVLVMLPTRSAARKFMQLLFELLPQGTQIANKGRFYQEFCTEVEELTKANKSVIKREQLPASTAYMEDDLVHGTHPVLREDKQRYKGAKTRPLDYLQAFGGNKGEAFRVGVTILGRKSVKLFADFYNSDLILASPLGVRLAAGLDVDADFDSDDEESEIDEEGEEDNALVELGYRAKDQKKGKKSRENSAKDFLSSIEMFVVDDADVLLMQNWQHLVDVINALNHKPTKLRTDTDFSRIREYFLEEMSANFRQTIVLSQYSDPFINGLAPRELTRKNCAGSVKVRRATYDPELNNIEKKVSLTFTRIHATDRMSSSDDNFEHFRENIIPLLKKESSAGTLLFVPSYFDYVRVRNVLNKVAAQLGQEYDASKKSKNRPRGRDGKRIARTKLDPFAAQSALFCCLSEYSEPSSISRVRGDFFKGKARILLVTERFHFYYRYAIRGISGIVFYSPPVHNVFYSELVNLVEAKSTSKVSMLYTKYEAKALERIAGTKLAQKMLTSDKDTFAVTLDEG